MTQMQVWMIEYAGGFTSNGGRHIKQDVTEWLIATDHALLKFKVCRNQGSERVKLFTDIQAQGRLLDLNTIKKHDFYRRMHKAAGGSPLRQPEQMPIYDLQALMEQSDLEPLIAADDKARNAMMTALGHHGDLTLPAVMEKAKEVTKTQRQVAIQEKTLVMAQQDDLWGIF